jgi:hypothetical protein
MDRADRKPSHSYVTTMYGQEVTVHVYASFQEIDKTDTVPTPVSTKRVGFGIDQTFFEDETDRAAKKRRRREKELDAE